MLTEARLTDELRAALPRDRIVIVHSGFRALGRVEGGPATVARALVAALGERGTLLAPAFTTDLIDPSTWPVPPPPEEQERLRAAMPCFDPATSPPHKMGAVATALWRHPGALRSEHPVTSWVAIGPEAGALTRDHHLEDPEGLEGPVGRAYRADALVVLLGVGCDANTTIHLAESMLDMPHLYALPDRYPVQRADGSREWVPIKKTTKCSDGFLKLEPHLEAAGVVRRVRIGEAETQLLRSRDVVRVACALLAGDPAALLCDDPECVHCPTSRALLASWRAPRLDLLP